MAEFSMERFTIKNLDGASCAAKIEDGLKKVDGVDDTHAGYLIIGDEIRPDAQQTTRDLRGQGFHHVAMLIGDNICTAEAVSHRLGLDRFHADLLPENKVVILEK
jgi:Cd2+/Zn2+-exporting ATPase